MDTIGIIAAILAALLMGTMGIFSRMTGLPPETMTFCRLFFGAGYMLLYLILIRRTSVLSIWPSWPVLLNGLMLSAFIVFYVQAMNLTTMANAIMLVYLAPVAASVIAHFFMGERLNLAGLLLICGALSGFGMMMGFKVDGGGDSTHLLGIGFGLLSMGAYAAFILINRVVRTEIHVYTRTFYQLLTGSAVMVPFLIESPPQIAAGDWIWLLGTGLFPGFLAIFCAVTALSRLPAATFGTLAYVEPVAVVVFGWVLFGELLGPLQLSGCLVVILCGIGQAYVGRTPARLNPDE